ncbi:MAG: hypothetical protein QOK15_2754 [Nocardioidaceae bacterium]|jgi:deazaflavin-dependent oxidoreductase (nitroreductase family)|nr:hypothetical protein [Nocardioidaceae bacterium]
MLVAVVREPHRIVVAASNGGADTHPHWFLNLSADPHVEVLIDGRRRPMIASVADAAARARLWPQVVRDSPAYQRYQERTSREIPLVILTER